ncbi:non-homologous end-joining DNA ligase [Glycomyces sp. NPDC047369]
MARSRPAEILVEGRTVILSHPDKILYPGEGITKIDVVAYYERVAPVMLPHLAGRPLTLLRHPEGIDQPGFFQKHPNHFPSWVETITMPKSSGGTSEAIVCEDAATLVYLAAHALEFHIRPATVDDLAHPDLVVVDIDPPGPAPAPVLRRIARLAGEVFRAIGLTPFVQATGGRGFHVLAPLDRSAGFDAVRALAGDIASLLAASDPDLLTVQQRIDRRGGRIFLDVNRNGRGQTFAAPYTLRARPGAGVATPLEWAELARATPAGHTIASIPRRLARKADPWVGLAADAGSALEARERLAGIRARVGLR